MLLPSPAYIRSTEGVRRSWLFPWYYVHRPAPTLPRSTGPRDPLAAESF